MHARPSRPHSRRRFLATAAAASTPLLLPRRLPAAPAPNEKLDIAFIGMGGQIQGHVRNLLQLGHNVVALCDVDARQLTNTRARHKEAVAGAKDYRDYRRLFDAADTFDAVVIATPDHWHAPLCTRAIEAGKHVYCEKPLTHTVAEARALRELAGANPKVVTQTGNQGSASGNLRRSIELIRSGLFGGIRDIHVWHPAHGWPSGVDRPETEDPVPEGLDWDFWCGPSPLRPFKEGIYHPAKWRGWYDFGNGSLGDFCCHSFNMPVRALDLDYPERIEVSGTELGRESFARSCTVRFLFPRRDERGPVKLHFHTGGDLPPEAVMTGVVKTFGGVPRVGCLLVGEKGQLSAGLWNSQCYVKMNEEETFRGWGNHELAKPVPQTLPRVKSHMAEWVDACRGGPKTFADFGLGGHLTEIGLAGIVALRLQRDIDWDGEKMEAPGEPGAAAYVRKQDRKKWLG